MRPCWGKIPTSNMALKWRYQTRCNGDKRHEDELNTDTWLTPQNSKRPHLKLIIQTRDICISCCGLWGQECLKNAFHKPLVCSLCTDPTPVRKGEWRGGGWSVHGLPEASGSISYQQFSRAHYIFYFGQRLFKQVEEAKWSRMLLYSEVPRPFSR